MLRKKNLIKKGIITILYIVICIKGFPDDTAQTRKIDLNVVLERGIFGLPKYIANPGLEAYIDLDRNSVQYTDYGRQPEHGWDILFTYIVKETAMGPMGKHPVPYLLLKTNKDEDAGYFTCTDESARFPAEFSQDYIRYILNFEADSMLKYKTPTEIFIFQTSEKRVFKLFFTEITGIKKDNSLFSVELQYSEIIR